MAKKPKRYKAGTIVTGRDGHLWVSMEHQYHPWVLEKSTKAPEVGAGYVAVATCMICQESTPPLTIEYWQQKADRAFMQRAVRIVREQIEELMEADIRLCERLREMPLA